MKNEPLILVKRIQLHLACDDKDQRDALMQTLYSWQRICFQAANLICSHLFVQDRIKDFFYLAEGIRYKLADQNKDPLGLFNTSGMNTVYALMAKRFKGQIPMRIISALKMTIAKTHHQEKDEYYQGQRSVRNYRLGLPIPFQATDITRIRPCPLHKEFQFTIFQIPFRTYLRRDNGDKRNCMEALVLNRSVLKTSSIQLLKGKIYLLASFVQQPAALTGHQLIAEAELSIEVPIILTFNKKRFTIGSKEDFYYKRLAIQAAYRRKQQAVLYNRTGHGKKRREKSLTHYKDKEHCFVTRTLHLYSARLIELCIQHKVGTLLLRKAPEQNANSIDEANAMRNRIVLRNWSYYSLTEKVKYKAFKAGIELIIE